MLRRQRPDRALCFQSPLSQLIRHERRPWAHLDTTTMSLVASLSPRRRSGERVKERGFQLAAPIRWKVPLSPALSPLVPRRERERGASAMVVVSRGARRPFPAELVVAIMLTRFILTR